MLEKLAKKYGTDKLEHGYIPYYEKYLPKKINSLLEFGCYKGASIRMWKEYFPGSEIATFDLFQEFDIQEELKSEGIKAFKGNVIYHDDLAQLDNTYDIIIEDSSHNSHDQQTIFIESLLTLINDGGVYVVEDLHCCNDEFYWNYGIDKFEDTILWLLKGWTKQAGFQENKYVYNYIRDYLNVKVEDVKVFDDKISFIFVK